MEDTFRGYGAFHKAEDDFVHSGVDIFSMPTKEMSCEFSRESVHRPMSENSEGPFEFFLPAEGDSYIDCEGFRLQGYTQFMKIKSDGSLVNVLEAAEGDNPEDKVAPINFLPGMLWNMKELYFNGFLVNYVTQPFDNVKSYIETELSYGTDIKSTVLKECVNWLPNKDDETGAMGENWKVRRKLWAKGKKVPFSVPLQLDVLNTDKYLPNKLDLNIRLTRAHDELCT